MPRLYLPLRLAFLLLLLAFAGQAVAESCAYREGIMALQQGNPVRGMALLRMASRDGDARASQALLALQNVDKKASVSMLAQLSTIPK